MGPGPGDASVGEGDPPHPGVVGETGRRPAGRAQPAAETGTPHSAGAARRARRRIARH